MQSCAKHHAVASSSAGWLGDSQVPIAMVTAEAATPNRMALSEESPSINKSAITTMELTNIERRVTREVTLFQKKAAKIGIKTLPDNKA